MAIATKQKPKTTHHKKRVAAHHRQTKHYVKSYWPYLPMLAVVGLGIFVNSLLSHPTAVLGVQSNLSQQALLNATNIDRVTNKQPALKSDIQLQLAAQAKANDMIHNNYWSHVSPSGEQPWTFVTNTGYQYQAAGENLAYGFTSADGVMNAWMLSPEHRQNLLDATYSQVGFGVAQSANYLGKGPETIVVAMYALPSGAAPADLNNTVTPDNTTSVSRLETIAGPAISGFAVGLIGALAVVAILIRHGIAWRKLVSRGELFVLNHPVIDTALVAVVVMAVILNHTAGFIR